MEHIDKSVDIVKGLENNDNYKEYKSKVGKLYKISCTIGEKKACAYKFIYDLQVKPRAGGYKGIMNNGPEETYSYIAAKQVDGSFLSDFKHLCTEIDINQFSIIYTGRSHFIDPVTNPNNEVSCNYRELFNKCFDEIYNLSDRITDIYKERNKDSELIRDKLIGRYFKVIGDDSEYVYVHKIISADNTEDRPEYFDSLFIEFVEDRFVSCRIDSDSIKRACLIDPEEVKEISENEFLVYLNKAKDQVKKIVSK